MNTLVGGTQTQLQNTVTVKPVIPTILRQSKPTLIIPEIVEQKIKYICNKINLVEWSGTLFYSIVSGTIDKPDELVLKCEEIYLQDKGTSAHTQFKYGEDILDIYDQYPDLEECKTAMLHSHNSMATFFSGEDMSELTDNCGIYDFYLSLIVNNKGDRLAKIAYMGKQEVIEKSYKKTTNKYKNSLGSWVNFFYPDQNVDEVKEIDVMFHHDVEIQVEGAISFDTFFLNRVELISNPPMPVYNTNTYKHTQPNHPSNLRYYNDDWDFDRTYPKTATIDDIPEDFTDAEIVEFANRLLSKNKQISSTEAKLELTIAKLSGLKHEKIWDYLEECFDSINFNKVCKIVFKDRIVSKEADIEIKDAIYDKLVDLYGEATLDTVDNNPPETFLQILTFYLNS